MSTLIYDGYVLDTSAIIDLFRYYPPETFAGLWGRIDALVKEGRLLCPEEVLRELKKKEDDASKWLEEHRTLVIRQENVVWRLAKKIANRHDGLVDTSRTIPQADPFVIALAKQLKWSVVTSERTRGFGAVNIPSVCRHESVPCLSLLQLFATEGWKI